MKFRLNKSLLGYIDYLGYYVEAEETGINIFKRQGDNHIGFLAIVSDGLLPVVATKRGMKILSKPVSGNRSEVIFWIEEIIRQYEIDHNLY